jgi:hypothetical protein
MRLKKHIIIVVVAGIVVAPLVALGLAAIFAGPIPPTDSPERIVWNALVFNNFFWMLPWGLAICLILSGLIYICTCGQPESCL